MIGPDKHLTQEQYDHLRAQGLTDEDIQAEGYFFPARKEDLGEKLTRHAAYTVDKFLPWGLPAMERLTTGMNDQSTSVSRAKGIQGMIGQTQDEVGPVADAAMNVAGMLPWMLATGGGVPAALTTGTKGLAAARVGAGAIPYGMAAGARGTPADASGTAYGKNIAKGGFAGAATGAATSAILQGGAGLFERAKRALGHGEATPAEQLVQANMQQGPVEASAEAAAAEGKPVILADLMGNKGKNLVGAATGKTAGPEREALAQVLDDRAAGAPARMEQDVIGAIGTNPKYAQEILTDLGSEWESVQASVLERSSQPDVLTLQSQKTALTKMSKGATSPEAVGSLRAKIKEIDAQIAEIAPEIDAGMARMKKIDDLRHLVRAADKVSSKNPQQVALDLAGTDAEGAGLYRQAAAAGKINRGVKGVASKVGAVSGVPDKVAEGEVAGIESRTPFWAQLAQDAASYDTYTRRLAIEQNMAGTRSAMREAPVKITKTMRYGGLRGVAGAVTKVGKAVFSGNVGKAIASNSIDTNLGIEELQRIGDEIGEQRAAQVLQILSAGANGHHELAMRLARFRALADIAHGNDAAARSIIGRITPASVGGRGTPRQE